jgi:hypothetical protein
MKDWDRIKFAGVGIILSLFFGLYTQNPWFFAWFLYSVALGNYTIDEDKKKRR